MNHSSAQTSRAADKSSSLAGAKRWWAAAAAALVIAALIIWQAWPQPPLVEVVPAQICELIGHLSATGEVEGRLAKVGAKVAGEVAAVYVREGDAVTEGAPLARISPGPSGLISTPESSIQVIDSPFAGVVGRRYVDPGDMAMPGQPLFAIVDPAKLWVVAFVNDIDIPRVHQGMPVQVSLPSYLSHVYQGKVTAISQLAEPRSQLESGARTVRVRIELDEPLPGMIPGIEVNVDARVVMRSRTLLIPAEAVVEDKEQRWVWVVRNKRAEKQPITTGATNYLAVEVLQGLAEGDLVVVTEKDRLESGRAVRPHEISVTLNVE